MISFDVSIGESYRVVQEIEGKKKSVKRIFFWQIMVFLRDYTSVRSCPRVVNLFKYVFLIVKNITSFIFGS